MNSMYFIVIEYARVSDPNELELLGPWDTIAEAQDEALAEAIGPCDRWLLLEVVQIGGTGQRQRRPA